jgi:hypothetical protein
MKESPDIHCRVEPSVFQPYSPVSIRVYATIRSSLPENVVLSCQLPNSFLAFRQSQSHTQQLQTDDPAVPHFVSFRLLGGQRDASFKVSVERREHLTDDLGEVRHGRRVFARLSGRALEAGETVVITFAGMMSPWVANQQERILVAVDGTPVEPWPVVRVVGGPAVWHRLIVPSCARPGESFRVMLVSLDEYDNVSSSHFAEVALALEDGPLLERDISFAGSYETTTSVEESGIVRLVASGLRGVGYLASGYQSEAVVSNPIHISTTPQGPYWGDLHAHTFMSADAVGNEPYQYARDVSGLDFAGVCDHSNAHLPDNWKRIKKWAADFDDPGRFVTILGFEGGSLRGIHHNLYYRRGDVDIVDGFESERTSYPDEVFRAHLERHEVLSQLHQSGTCSTDMREPFYPQTRLIEIFSSWGQSEYYNPDHALSYEINRVRYPETRLTVSGRGPFYARDAWAEGKRYVTIASSDDHFGQPGKAHRGIAGVLSSSLSRESIFDSMKAGQCYGTTGERILIDFRLNGLPMGSEVSAKECGALDFAIEVHGTDVLSVVEVFRFRFGSDDGWQSPFVEEFPDVGLKGDRRRDVTGRFREDFAGPAVYYLRVRQKYLVRDRPVYAWSSPIWVND